MRTTFQKLIAVIAIFTAIAQAPAQVSQSPWKDPGTILDEATLREATAGDAADYLRGEFKGQIDIIVPDSLKAKPISIRLTKVTATELFNAMNQLFMAAQEPLRWELSMNGKRPTAALCQLTSTKAPAPGQSDVRPEATERTAIYIGDLISEKNGDLNVGDIKECIIQSICGSGSGKELSQGFGCFVHDATQLLIVSGTPGELKLVRDIVEALKQRAIARRQQKPVEPAKP